ncbi:MAG: diguanylate cyclase [Elusimicrobia bacterium]|nr:diguanylate cyclase [Elusimicrobiota bacterium]
MPRPHIDLAGIKTPLIYLSTDFLRAKEYLEAILSSSSDAIMTTDVRGRIVYWSPGAERILGLPAASVVGRPARDFYAGGRKEAERVQRRLLLEKSFSDLETVLLGSKDRAVPVSISASLIHDRRGAVIGTLGIAKDVSRRIELERRLRELSITDELTGLFNARHLHERLASETARARRMDQDLSLIVVDLDRFKEANDRFGHVYGNRILRATADLLRAAIRKDVDMAYRYGGDEFVLLLPSATSKAAGRIADRLRLAVPHQPYTRLVTLSVGMATLRPREKAESLLKRADARMYQDKRRRNASAR